MPKQELNKGELAGRRNYAKMIIACQIGQCRKLLDDNKNHGTLYYREKRFLEKQIFNLGLLLSTWEGKVPLGEIPKTKEKE